jgi:hypothetical protein
MSISNSESMLIASINIPIERRTDIICSSGHINGAVYMGIERHH